MKPDYAIADNNRGNTKRLKGDLDGALADYTKTIELKPDFSEAYYFRGVVRRTKGEMDQSIADFNQVIELNPKARELIKANGYLTSGTNSN